MRIVAVMPSMIMPIAVVISVPIAFPSFHHASGGHGDDAQQEAGSGKTPRRH
jgi:hypothetical protein